MKLGVDKPGGALTMNGKERSGIEGRGGKDPEEPGDTIVPAIVLYAGADGSDSDAREGETADAGERENAQKRTRTSTP